jgi:hypothetical protein
VGGGGADGAGGIGGGVKEGFCRHSCEQGSTPSCVSQEPIGLDGCNFGKLDDKKFRRGCASLFCTLHVRDGRAGVIRDAIPTTTTDLRAD